MMTVINRENSPPIDSGADKSTLGNSLKEFIISEIQTLEFELKKNILGIGSQTLAPAEKGTDTGGTLTVLSHYMAAGFVTAGDGHGGGLMTETAQPEIQHSFLATPHAG